MAGESLLHNATGAPVIRLTSAINTYLAVSQEQALRGNKTIFLTCSHFAANDRALAFYKERHSLKTAGRLRHSPGAFQSQGLTRGLATFDKDSAINAASSGDLQLARQLRLKEILHGDTATMSCFLSLSYVV